MEEEKLSMIISRTTLVLAVIFVIGIGHVLFFEPRLKSTTERRAAANLVLDFTADEIHRIRIRRDHWTSALIERTGEHNFRIAEPAARGADMAMVARLLSALEFLERQASFQNVPGEGPAFSTYGLEPPRLQLSIELAGGREEHLAFGERSADGRGVYLQVWGDDRINVVNEDAKQAAEILLDSAGAL